MHQAQQSQCTELKVCWSQWSWKNWATYFKWWPGGAQLASLRAALTGPATISSSSAQKTWSFQTVFARFQPQTRRSCICHRCQSWDNLAGERCQQFSEGTHPGFSGMTASEWHSDIETTGVLGKWRPTTSRKETIESGLEIKAGIFVNKALTPGNVWNSKMSYLNVWN